MSFKLTWAASSEVLWWPMSMYPALDEVTTFTLFCCVHVRIRVRVRIRIRVRRVTCLSGIQQRERHRLTGVGEHSSYDLIPVIVATTVASNRVIVWLLCCHWPINFMECHVPGARARATGWIWPSVRTFMHCSYVSHPFIISYIWHMN